MLACQTRTSAFEEASMGTMKAHTLLPMLVAVMLWPSTAQAQEEVSVSIAREARLGSDGAVIITVRITCGPLPGTEDFREAHAGAGQPKTGAAAEGGVDGTVVCDGTERVHTARMFPHTDEAFRRGPARATVTVFACNIVGDDQVCVEGSDQRRIVIRGRTVA
jgi:hypothetical protein